MNFYLILDSLPIRYQSQENLYNISLLFSPEEQVIYNYDKSNLFPLMNEAKIFSAGSFNNVPIENSFPKRVYSEIITEMNEKERYQGVVLDFQSRYPFLKKFSITLRYSQKQKNYLNKIKFIWRQHEYYQLRAI